MIINKASEEYFSWIYGNMIGPEIGTSYHRLLRSLHNHVFKWSVVGDDSREEDGKNLRWHYILDTHQEESADSILRELNGPCSVLEMMAALASRCESNIMDNTSYGDRTKQWFWSMLVNMGLGAMYDSNFDSIYVDQVLTRFVNRDYSPDGTGGLFRIPNCKADLRAIDIWTQLCWYLDSKYE